MRRPADPFWLAAPTRFAGMSVRAARMALALAVLLLLASWAGPPQGIARAAADAGAGDNALYGAIVDGVRHGGSYYPVAAEALRAGDYPLKPFVTFRLPTLAVVEAHLPGWLVGGLLGVLVTATLIAWFGRLSPALPRLAARVAAALLIAGGLIVYAQASLATFHEIWAGLFIALSLALRRPGRWVEAVALGLCAMLVRETAALFVAIMAVVALLEGERREAATWFASLGVLALAVALHAHAVAQVVGPLDAESPGWTGMLGFGHFARTMARSTVLDIFPPALAAPLVVLAMLGWAGWRDPLATRIAAILAAYAVLLSLFGRADTFYWGLLVAAVLLPGLVMAPDALRDLFAAALDKRRITVRRVVR
ncbi:hypothetical protein SAMN05192583_0023 [Sphingomonas gellani]|uniref:Dolichyl-phosphate-mannose-protein mannosyltransferase n=1 Tax=Sphingomonas gellani TaxID=1166340 RepID=A0A1H7Y1X3_9SPHN|nr:hypothetical protein [Sphingomonas gellani]SEM39338.1 hypothetical protein SAMN05192583_0023 [Sphingomonas gellani]